MLFRSVHFSLFSACSLKKTSSLASVFLRPAFVSPYVSECTDLIGLVALREMIYNVCNWSVGFQRPLNQCW